MTNTYINNTSNKNKNLEFNEYLDNLNQNNNNSNKNVMNNLIEKKEYFENSNDFYYYKKLYEFIKDKITVDFHKNNEKNFLLIMIILQNELFGDFDFMKTIELEFQSKDKNNYFFILNKLYSDKIIKIKDFEFIFNSNLLTNEYLKELINTKSNFFSLNFEKKYDLLNNYKNYIETIFFMNSFHTFINFDKNFFYNNSIINSSKSSIFNSKNIIENFYINNFFFKEYNGINNINKLYTNFLSFEDNTIESFLNNLLHKNNNLKLNSTNKYLLYKNHIDKTIISKHGKGLGFFSKKFNIGSNKKNNLMIFYFEKIEDDFILQNINKFIPQVSDKKKQNILSIPTNIKNSKIRIKKFDNNTYDFCNFKFKKGIFSNKDIKISFRYLVQEKILLIMIDDKINENLYYKIKDDKISRIIINNDNNYGQNLDIIQLNNKDNKDNNIIYINQIILPYEFIIVCIMFGLNHFLKDLKKTSTTQFKPYKISPFKNKNKIFKFKEPSNINNLINQNDSKNKDKNFLFDKTFQLTDSWFFQFYYYKSKTNEMNYYFNNFLNLFKKISNKIDELNNKKEDIINEIRQNIFNELKNLMKSYYNNNFHNFEFKIFADKLKKKILFLQKIDNLISNNNDYEKIIMMFQFNIDWVNYYVDFTYNNNIINNSYESFDDFYYNKIGGNKKHKNIFKEKIKKLKKNYQNNEYNKKLEEIIEDELKDLNNNIDKEQFRDDLLIYYENIILESDNDWEEYNPEKYKNSDINKWYSKILNFISKRVINKSNLNKIKSNKIKSNKIKSNKNKVDNKVENNNINIKKILNELIKKIDKLKLDIQNNNKKFKELKNELSKLKNTENDKERKKEISKEFKQLKDEKIKLQKELQEFYYKKKELEKQLLK